MDSPHPPHYSVHKEKGGVSILTKEKIRIANKISKGEDLTPEESDFYKAVKEDIDKRARYKRLCI